MKTLYILIALAAISAFAILVIRSVLHAALSLMVCLLAIAGVYIALSAEFLAVVQILVYAGGILLLIIFGIMVTNRQQHTRQENSVPGILLATALTAMLWFALGALNTGEVIPTTRSIDSIGVDLMTKLAGPFEIAGLLILVSMIGAMVIASYNRRST